MRPRNLRTPLLGLTLWAAIVTVGGLAWAALWQLVRLALADLEPTVVGTVAAPAGAALALIGLLMAGRVAVQAPDAARRGRVGASHPAPPR